MDGRESIAGVLARGHRGRQLLEFYAQDVRETVTAAFGELTLLALTLYVHAMARAGSPCHTRGAVAGAYHTGRFTKAPRLAKLLRVPTPTDRGPGQSWRPGTPPPPLRSSRALVRQRRNPLSDAGLCARGSS